eukprot:scaffold29770_cov42-Phaeocystis_antarctica.AAC.1
MRERPLQPCHSSGLSPPTKTKVGASARTPQCRSNHCPGTRPLTSTTSGGHDLTTNCHGGRVDLGAGEAAHLVAFAAALPLPALPYPNPNPNPNPNPKRSEPARARSPSRHRD